MAVLEDDALLASAKRWLLAATVAAAVLLAALFGKSPKLLGVAWALTVLGGWVGVYRLVQAGGAWPILRLLAPLLFLPPLLNLVPLLGFLALAFRRSRPPEAPARRSAVPDDRPRNIPQPAPPRAGPADKPAVLRAVASVKFAGLTVPDGQVLQVSLGTGVPGMAAHDAPLVVAWKGFGVLFAVDAGSHYSYLNHRQMQEAELDAAQVLSIGLGNLAGWAGGDGKSAGLRLQQQGAAHGVVAGGQFEASLTLLDTLWDKAFQKMAPNGAVVAVPAADVLAFCDARSAEGIAELRAIVQRVEQSGARMLIRELFVRRDGRWTEFTGGAYS